MPPIPSSLNQPASMQAAPVSVATLVSFVPIPGAVESAAVRRESPSLSSISSTSPPTAAGVYMYPSPSVTSGAQYFQPTVGSDAAAPFVYYVPPTATTSLPSASMTSPIYQAQYPSDTMATGMMGPTWMTASVPPAGDQTIVPRYTVGPLPDGSATAQSVMEDMNTVTTTAAGCLPTVSGGAAGPIYVTQQPMTYTQYVPHQFQTPPQQQQLYPCAQMQAPAMPLYVSTDNPLINSTNMEIVWHSDFNGLFATFGHPWQLEPAPFDEDHEAADVPTAASRLLAGKSGVRQYKDSAKVRFHCKSCGNAWTSMKGRVIFWIQLLQSTGPAAAAKGTVQFRLFGQRCQKCNIDGYENAMWYPEEVHKVVWNVYNRVGQLFYGFQRSSAEVGRRIGRPRSQHNSSLCQACAEGICNENRDTSSGSSSTAALAQRLQQQLVISNKSAFSSGSSSKMQLKSMEGFKPASSGAYCYDPNPIGDAALLHWMPQAIMSH